MIADNPYRTAAPGDLPGDWESDDELLARIDMIEIRAGKLQCALQLAKGERADLIHVLRRAIICLQHSGSFVDQAVAQECRDVLTDCGEKLPVCMTTDQGGEV